MKASNVPVFQSLRRVTLLLFFAAATEFISFSANAVPLKFSAASYYPAGTNVVTLAVADFNRDGNADVATVSNNPDFVNVLLGRGDGTFLSPSQYGAPYSARSLAAGDLNGDARPDIVVAGFTNISVLLGDGSGGFSVISLTNDLSGSTLCLADFNKDGKLDAASSQGRVVSGIGLGAFGQTKFYSGSGGDSVSAADMNADGHLDLVFAGYYSFAWSFSIVTNLGNGTFGSAVFYGPVNNGTSLVVSDFNDDRRPDIATLNGNSVAVRTNAGGMNFGTTNRITLTNFTPRSLAGSDFDFDGKVDLLVQGTGGKIEFFSGNGDGSFKTNLTITVQSFDSYHPRTVAAADFNRDGRIDAAFLGNRFVGILLNTTPPELTISVEAGYIQINWYSHGYTLESSTNLAAPNAWMPFPFPPVIVSNRCYVADFNSGNKFYRLKK